MKKLLSATVVLLISLSLSAQTSAFRIPVEQKIVDGLVSGVNPGDTIFILAGQRRELILQNITGTAKKPVVIINQGGKVIINTKEDYGIYCKNSIHFKVTGTGSQDIYGFEIASSANHGLVVSEFSSFAEADHLEVHHVGYAAFVAKTDPNCTRKDMRFFLMQELSFHDNLIHDILAEGYYVGYSWFPIRRYPCGADSLLYSHEIHGIRIYNNSIYNTGQEGIQVGTGTRDVKIYSNKVYNYGVTHTLWQNHGIQIGEGTTGDFFNNYVSTGPAEGVSLFGGGNNRVYDNVIMNTGAAAIYHNDRGAVDGSHYEITNNIIINPNDSGVTLVSTRTKGNLIRGNTIVMQHTDGAIIKAGTGEWDISGNRVSTSMEGAGLDKTVIDQKTPTLNASFIPFKKNNGIRMIEEDKPIQGNYSFKVKYKEPLVRIFDGAGIVQDARLLSSKGKKYQADFSGLPTGIYYISVMAGGNGQEVRRIIVKRELP